MSLEVRALTAAERAALHDAIAALEHGVRYPLGRDSFAVDHGRDYFAAFTRLGELSYFVCLDRSAPAGRQVVATCAAVLRRVPPRPGARPVAAWFLCDLKVAPSRRGQRLPWRLFAYGFPRSYPRCGRGYGITMNRPGEPNPVVHLAERFPMARSAVGTILHIYTLDAAAMTDFEPALRAARGPLSYLSLRGRRDLVLQSTGAPMPVLHVQHGPCAEPGSSAPQPGAWHMLCVPEGDALIGELARRGLAPAAEATVLHHRMSRWRWDFVLSSDI